MRGEWEHGLGASPCCVWTALLFRLYGSSGPCVFVYIPITPFFYSPLPVKVMPPGALPRSGDAAVLPFVDLKHLKLMLFNVIGGRGLDRRCA